MPPNFKNCLAGGRTLWNTPQLLPILLESAAVPRMGGILSSGRVSGFLADSYSGALAGVAAADCSLAYSCDDDGIGIDKCVLLCAEIVCKIFSLTGSKVLRTSLFATHSTPCGTRTRNLRIRGPTPCPLGQGGM